MFHFALAWQTVWLHQTALAGADSYKLLCLPAVWTSSKDKYSHMTVTSQLDSTHLLSRTAWHMNMLNPPTGRGEVPYTHFLQSVPLPPTHPTHSAGGCLPRAAGGPVAVAAPPHSSPASGAQQRTAPSPKTNSPEADGGPSLHLPFPHLPSPCYSPPPLCAPRPEGPALC